VSRDSEIVPGTPDGSFRVIYQFPGEALSEIRNATVHGCVCVALTRTATGYRLYWAVYVRPVSWLTRPYLIAIEPFRRILYPAMLRRIRRLARGLRCLGLGMGIARSTGGESAEALGGGERR
jgi:hypothetical protein